MKLLVKIASRSRPKDVVRVVKEFARQARDPRSLSFILSLDGDDPTVKDVQRELAGFRQIDIRVGSSKCKVEAINRDLEGAQFDVMIVAADDQMPTPGYDQAIARDFARHFPNLDGALHYNDGHTQARLNTIPVIGYNLFRKFGYVYHPDYTSLWCDNEYSDLLGAMGRLVYIPQVMIRHNHPSNTGRPRDALLDRNESFYQSDEAVYRRRAAMVRPSSRWGFDSPDTLLSLCIPSLNSRATSRRQLLDELNRQINAHPERRRVEVWMDIDGGQKSVGAKRNGLLRLCKGRFAAFIDDDDMIAPTYVEDILAAIAVDPEIDCIGIEGIYTENGGPPRRFIHSIKCGGFYEADGVFYRTPNHLNPIRLDHALAAGFPEINCGEDRQYADRLWSAGVLKRETMIPKGLYFYKFDTRKTATQRRR